MEMRGKQTEDVEQRLNRWNYFHASITFIALMGLYISASENSIDNEYTSLCAVLIYGIK